MAKDVRSILDQELRFHELHGAAKKKGNLDTVTERRPWEDPGKRWQSASKGTRPQKKPTLHL